MGVHISCGQAPRRRWSASGGRLLCPNHPSWSQALVGAATAIGVIAPSETRCSTARSVPTRGATPPRACQPCVVAGRPTESGPVEAFPLLDSLSPSYARTAPSGTSRPMTFSQAEPRPSGPSAPASILCQPLSRSRRTSTLRIPRRPRATIRSRSRQPRRQRPTPQISPVAQVASSSASTACTTSSAVPNRPSGERAASR